MRIALANLPWTLDGEPGLWGVRAGSRWPHLQRRASPGRLPRYVPFPFFMSIAAAVAERAGHKVLLLDAVAENVSPEEAAERICAFKPALLFAEVSTPSLHSDMRQLRELRRRLPDAVFVCGGSHSPKLASHLMRHEPLPDFWLAGEYERSLAALAGALESGGDAAKTPGLIPRGGDFSGFASAGELDSLPEPLFERLPMGSYSDPVCGLPASGAQGWLSRGCPFNCSFCVWPQTVYGGRDYRARSIDLALDEIEGLISGYGCESFYFDDDTANIGERRMAELSRKIVARGLSQWPWAMMARADCMSPSMIESLAGAGMYAVKYGVESFSPELIDSCGKATRLDKLFEAIEATRRHRVKMHLTFTFGLPGETERTVRETMEAAIRIAPESAQFSVCTPFPGTKFYDECVERGWLVTDDWSRFLGSGEDVVVSTPQLSAQALKESYEWALSEWSSFLASRLERRKLSLLGKISSRTRRGEKWHFSGERDFASFLFDKLGRDVPEPSSLAPEEADFIVVVSRHDEEKLRRRLSRDPKTSGKTLLGLYCDE